MIKLTDKYGAEFNLLATRATDGFNRATSKRIVRWA